MSRDLDETHDPGRKSWVESANEHPDFPIQNLPLGVFSRDGIRRCGVAIGDSILDLAALARCGLLLGEAQQAAEACGETLNPLLSLGAGPRRALRRGVSRVLSDPAMRSAIRPMLHASADCELHLPARIGGYTDFYVGINHASNIGRLFRPDTPLLPNYKHVPIAYHGRASSIRLSGEPVRRPHGQRKAPSSETPVFGPVQRLDYELELGVWIGPGNALGEPIPITQAHDHLAGLCLLNDWSARDIQTWEYQPLGPFLAKNFLTTISPWIVTAEALAPFRIAQSARPEGDPEPLPYLHDEEARRWGGLAATLAVTISTAAMRAAGTAPHRLSLTDASHMYWTAEQMIAHHASNGCNLEAGDLLGTGTISAPSQDGYGSLIEITRNGAAPVHLPSGETRAFLEDGDEIALVGHLQAEGFVGIGFGPCVGRVEPARPPC